MLKQMKPSPKSIRSRVALAIVLFGLGALLSSQTAPREQVGPLATGGFLLNSGWRLQPAGKQIALDTLPMSSVVTPDGKYMLVLNCGYKPPSISVIDLGTGTVTGNAPVADAWLGLAISPRGDRVYASGGSHGSIFEFSFTNGVLAQTREFPLVQEAARTSRDFTGDVTEFEVEARTVREAIRELDRRYPGFGEHIERRMAVAIDGEIHQDALFSALQPTSEVFLIPRIGGG